MNLYAQTDIQIKRGYEHQKNKESIKCCEVWLEAWDGLKDLMVEELLHDIKGLDKICEWSQFISNFVQDLESELQHTGAKDKIYYQKHITYCRELYERLNKDDQLTRENTRRAMAASYFILGEHERAEQEFEAMLQEDPEAGWVYMGWTDCYAWELKPPNYDRAYEIITNGLSRPKVRERDVLLERAIEITEKLGDVEKAKMYEHQLKQLRTVRVAKVGRNEPCPCGSGKKYKKCCGS